MDQDNKPSEENSQSTEPKQRPETPGRHDEYAKTDMPVFSPAHRPRALRIFTTITIVLLLILAGLFGWLWWQERNDEQQSASTQNTQQSEPQQAVSKCSEDFSIFLSQELNVEFCFPTAWGQVELTDARLLSEPNEGVAADTGSRWRLSFSEKSAVNIGLVSTDWSTNVDRGGTCVDPATQALPEFSPFSTEWNVETEIDTEPPQPSSAVRGIEVEEGEYLIEERVDDLFTSGACITGYTVIDNETYPFATSTYHYGPVDDVPVQMYMDDPEDYISSTDRADFATLVKSIKAYEE